MPLAHLADLQCATSWSRVGLLPWVHAGLAYIRASMGFAAEAQETHLTRKLMLHAAPHSGHWQSSSRTGYPASPAPPGPSRPSPRIQDLELPRASAALLAPAAAAPAQLCCSGCSWSRSTVAHVSAPRHSALCTSHSGDVGVAAVVLHGQH